MVSMMIDYCEVQPDFPGARDRERLTAALHKAAVMGHEQRVRSLLEMGVDANATDTNGCTALLHASNEGHTEIVRILLRKGGADVNARIPNSLETPIILANDQRNLSTIQCLVEEGHADLELRTDWGFTVLIEASGMGHDEIVRYLLDQRANVNAVDNDGCTALMRASSDGHTEIVKQLLRRGATSNWVDNDGSTALHAAVISGNKHVIQLLLQEGADWSASDIQNRTPIDLVAEGDTRAVVATFVQYFKGRVKQYFAFRDTILRGMEDETSPLFMLQPASVVPSHIAEYVGAPMGPALAKIKRELVRLNGQNLVHNADMHDDTMMWER